MDQRSHNGPWKLTIVHLEGMRLMRPEKVWRPIVTVEVDAHHFHETTLGADGQNINQKEVFAFDNVRHSSKVEFKIWHRSQSKKKKRKVLVATASHCLNEMLKKQQHELAGKSTTLKLDILEVSIPLQCRTADKASTSGNSKGRKQGGAILKMKIRPPPSFFKRRAVPSEGDSCDEENKGKTMKARPHWKDTDDSESASESDGSSIHTDIIIENADAGSTPATSQPSGLRKRTRQKRKIKSYLLDSDEPISESEESCSGSSSSSSYVHFEKRPLISDTSQTCIGDDEDFDYANSLIMRSGSSGEIIRFDEEQHIDEQEGFTRKGKGWLAFMSDLPLPLYTEKIVVPPNLTKPEKVICSFTMYSELASACCDDDFARVFGRLQHEWTFIGGLLVALAAVDTAVFSISPDSIFTVDSYARSAIAASSIASGLGIACDAWFLFRYNWAELQTFIIRARDVFDSYFFFALSARVPALCMFISSLSLMVFLGVVAFEAWPQGVLFVSFFVGIIMTLQFLAYGVHWVGTTVAEGSRKGGRGVVLVVRSLKRRLTG
ncbi:hypothetical protein CPC08DRAFT_823567 [Agrocybe pediades]|nr:hypothetical protein CPC08DRAFT_823567 [Agrocybe pediades]